MSQASERAEEWPGCPSCGQRRMTVCPYCQSAGQDFPAADAEYLADGSPMLTCPTCDEPFTPQYLKRCEWCGHPFADGTDVEVARSDVGRPEEPTDPLTPQAIATAVVLGLLALALVVWLLSVM